MRFYPVNLWNRLDLTDRTVRFAFTYDTFEKAEAYGKETENTYKDSKNIGVVSGENYNECCEKAKEYAS